MLFEFGEEDVSLNGRRLVVHEEVRGNRGAERACHAVALAARLDIRRRIKGGNRSI